MMLALLLYAYANKVHASRSIERLCDSDVAFRVICGSRRPGSRHDRAVPGGP